MSFSFKAPSGGTSDSVLPVAAIYGGTHDGKIIWIDTKPAYSKENLSEITEMVNKVNLLLPQSLKLDSDGILELCIAVAQKQPNTLKNKKHLELYKNISDSIYKRDLGNNFITLDGTLQFLPRYVEDQTDVIYLAGNMGSGKSYMTNKYLLEYLKENPENPIYFFSRNTSDKSITAPVIRVPITDELITDPIDIEEMADSIVCFDDTDNLQNKKHLEAVHRLMLDCIANGRKLGIRVLICRHLGNNRSATREILLESTQIVLFPGQADRMNKYIMKEYLGFSVKEITKISALATRWVCFSRVNPQYIISEHQIMTRAALSDG